MASDFAISFYLLLSPFYIFLVIADFSDRDKKTIRYT